MIRVIIPSGFGQEAVNLWKKDLEKFVQKVEIGIHGNCIVSLNGGQPKIMLDAHIDEVGFMVKYVDKEVYIYFFLSEELILVLFSVIDRRRRYSW